MSPEAVLSIGFRSIQLVNPLDMHTLLIVQRGMKLHPCHNDPCWCTTATEQEEQAPDTPSTCMSTDNPTTKVSSSCTRNSSTTVLQLTLLILLVASVLVVLVIEPAIALIPVANHLPNLC